MKKSDSTPTPWRQKRQHNKGAQVSNNGVDDLVRASYLRKTFLVEAVEVTQENMAEVARHIGKVVESREHGRHIEIDERIVPRFKKVYAGFFVTFFDEQIRVYTRRSFFNHFIAFDAEDFQADPMIDIWSIIEQNKG
jgi:hypothetical protein